MFGTLIVWGTDYNGFWKKEIKCSQSEITQILEVIGDYDSYDFKY